MGSFTYAILSHLDSTNDSLYQLFGRITGRMKRWGDKYVKTQTNVGKIINREKYHEPIYSAEEEVAKNVIQGIMTYGCFQSILLIQRLF